MRKKYEVHNQSTGLPEQADTFEEILAIRERIKQEYLETQKTLFTVTVLTELPDGSWRQTTCDENGEPEVPPSPFPSWVWNEQRWAWFAPVRKPISMDPSVVYNWDESTTSWVVVSE